MQLIRSDREGCTCCVLLVCFATVREPCDVACACVVLEARCPPTISLPLSLSHTHSLSLIYCLCVSLIIPYLDVDIGEIASFNRVKALKATVENVRDVMREIDMLQVRYHGTCLFLSVCLSCFLSISSLSACLSLTFSYFS